MANGPTNAKRFILHTDGAAKGNPGPAGIGIALYAAGSSEPVAAFGEYLGETTNNVAEYKALLRGLNEALLRGVEEIEARTDSELMARQIAGRYKVSAPQIIPLHAEARRLLSRFARASVVYVPREQNAMADKLANQGVAAGRGGGPKEKETAERRPAPAVAPTPAPDRPAYPNTYACIVRGERWCWDIDRLREAAQGLPILPVPLTQFDRLLDSDPWHDGKGATLRQVVEHARRIDAADLSKPILLAADGQIMDGLYQIARAYRDGRTTIDAVRFDSDPAPDFREPA